MKAKPRVKGTHKDPKVRAKARALYESGMPGRQVCKQVGIARNTLADWVESDGWVFRKTEPKLIRKEEEALEREAERHGITRAKVLSKLGHLVDAKTALVEGQMGYARIPLPEGTQVNDGHAIIEGKPALIVDDRETQVNIIKISVDVLGMKRPDNADALVAGVFSFYRQELAKSRGQK